jgi:NTE family protein
MRVSAASGRGIGLALSGGAARGIAHVAVLEVLEEEQIPIRAIAGTSAGAIVGALYAAGVPLAAIRRIALEIGWRDLFRFGVPRAALLPGDGLRHFLERVLPVADFAGLRLPFAAVAADLRTGERVDLVTGPLAAAVQASCSLPVLFAPLPAQGRLLVDGGVASQVPVRAVREALGADRVVAVDVNHRGMEGQPCDTLHGVAVQLAMLWTSRIAREEEREADALVRVNARGIALYDLRQGPELLRRGRLAARAALPRVRALLAGDGRGPH